MRELASKIRFRVRCGYALSLEGLQDTSKTLRGGYNKTQLAFSSLQCVSQRRRMEVFILYALPGVKAPPASNFRYQLNSRHTLHSYSVISLKQHAFLPRYWNISRPWRMFRHTRKTNRRWPYHHSSSLQANYPKFQNIQWLDLFVTRMQPLQRFLRSFLDGRIFTLCKAICLTRNRSKWIFFIATRRASL